MGKAEEAFEEARRRIAEAKRTGAERLDLRLEGLERIPEEIAGLTGLTELDLSSTGVSDVTVLAGLTGLMWLDLSSTGVSDVTALGGLTGLTTLYLRSTGVSDVTALGGLTGLTALDLRSTGVSDVTALGGLTGLTVLDLSSTGVSDVTALGGLTGLQWLDLRNTGVSDVTSLGGLTGLTGLDLRSTGVSDVTALGGLTGLTGLDLRNTGVSDVTALGGLTGLTVLDLRSTGVSDVTALGGLTGLTGLDLSNTGVSVAGLRTLAGLERLVTMPEYGDLMFEDSAATREDKRVAEISRFKRPKQRARVLFEYLETWVPPIPPELPEQTHHGLRYRVGPSGLVDYDPASSPGLATAQQRQLHAFLVEDAGQVAEFFGSGHNQPFAYVSQKLGRYGAGLGAALEEISPAIVWKVGNDLRLVLAADGGRRPGDMTNRPAFDVDQRAGLEGLVSTHNALVSLHPDLAALDAVAVDPAQRHVVERDRALMEAAIEAFAAQTRLILVEVVRDLRDLHDEALGETRAAIRAMRIEEESLENLIKAIVTQAIIEARGPSFIGLVAGDVRAAAVSAGVAAVGTALPPLAATYPQLVMVLQPHIAALMAAWHGKDYPVSDAVNWIMAKVKPARR